MKAQLLQQEHPLALTMLLASSVPSASTTSIPPIICETKAQPILPNAEYNSHQNSGEVVHTITEFKTTYNADCIEWCPQTEFADHFVYGTYQLEENELHEQKWLGNIVLNQLSLSEDETSYSVKENCAIQINGVFDVKWAPPHIRNKCLLAVASCDGFIQLIQVGLDSSVELMSKTCSSNISEGRVCKPLSVDWNPYNESLVTSDSSGSLSSLSLSNSSLQIKKTWKAHDFEAWISSFDYAQPHIVYSGGDDCLMKAWDLRTNLQSTTFQTKKHSMGVTTITKNKAKDYLLASGSYDEHIFLWDLRNIKKPITDYHVVGGGVWKLKWHPTLPNYLLVAAMHKGFHVVHINEMDLLTKELSYEKHTSLAYGVDWCHKVDWNKISKPHNKHIIASCSFYDNLIHLWEAMLKHEY